jgi:hypothetical protein
MPITYKTDLMPPEAIPAYQAKHPVGIMITLPDLANPGKSIAYTVEEVRVEDSDPHPETEQEVKRVTLVLKN